MNDTSRPSKTWAYVAVGVGLLLFLAGAASALGYLGLPAMFPGEDVLGSQLGEMAAIFLGLVCGALAIYHGLGSILNHASRPMRLPPATFFWLAFAVVLGLGNLLLQFEVAPEYLFPPLFLLGAALPTLGVVAWAARRLGWPITWRQAGLALVAGSTLSIFVALVAETILPFLAYLLVGPLEYLAGSFGDVLASSGPDVLERLFYSPLVVVFLITTALAAPIPEEFAKALSLPMFGRWRINEARQAFLIGLASGAGFAILENMLYQGVYARYGGWSWGGITLLRGTGAVLHPLCTGLIALGWFRARERGAGALLKAYLVSVGLHTLWNGGFEVFAYFTGLSYYGGLGPTLDLYGLAVEAILLVFLAALSAGLWLLLRRVAGSLGQAGEPILAPEALSPRAVAGLAFAAVLVLVPLGAALGPAWSQIRAVAVAGPPTPTPTALPPTSAPTATLAPTRLPPTSTPTPTLTPTPLPPTSTPTPTVTPTPLPLTSTLTRTQEIPAPLATATAAASWPIAFTDSFTSDTNRWPTGYDSSEFATIRQLVRGGKYRWDVVALQGGSWRTWHDPVVSDFHLTVEAQRISGPENASYGLIFRQVDDDTMYYFAVRENRWYSFSVLDNNEWTTLIDWTEDSVIRRDEVNRLTVLAEGSHFVFFINDQYVAEANDSRLSRGRAGVAIELYNAGDKATFEFDNFKLRAP